MCTRSYEQQNFWFWDYFPQMLKYQESRLSGARLYDFYCINSTVTDHAATTNSLLHIFVLILLYFILLGLYILFTYWTVSMYRKGHWHHLVFVLAVVRKGILLTPNTWLSPKLLAIRSVSFFLPHKFRCRPWVMNSSFTVDVMSIIPMWELPSPTGLDHNWDSNS
jgi:hypothetical protein